MNFQNNENSKYINKRTDNIQDMQDTAGEAGTNS